MKKYPKIYRWLSENCHTLKWLSAETGIPYQSLNDKMRGTSPLRYDDVAKIMAVTGLSFEEIGND